MGKVLRSSLDFMNLIPRMTSYGDWWQNATTENQSHSFQRSTASSEIDANIVETFWQSEQKTLSRDGSERRTEGGGVPFCNLSQLILNHVIHQRRRCEDVQILRNTNTSEWSTELHTRHLAALFPLLLTSTNTCHLSNIDILSGTSWSDSKQCDHCVAHWIRIFFF